MARLVLGTRGSPLALWQARHVAGLLGAAHPGLEIEERVVRTAGDARPDVPPESLDGTGVFVRRLQDALLRGEIDLAVHSLKDLPTTEPAGLAIAAIPERHDPRDALVTISGGALDALARGTTVGTSSVRRRCQLLHIRPDLRVVPMRGNVETRIQKLRSGVVGALVLAVAGLDRLEVRGVAISALDPEDCLPAVGQGALAVETRADDAATRALVQAVDHPPSAVRCNAERALLRHLGGGCLAPATAFASYEAEKLCVEGLVGDPDGRVVLVERERGAPESGEAIGVRLASRLLAAGAEAILAAVRPASADGDDGRG